MTRNNGGMLSGAMNPEATIGMERKEGFRGALPAVTVNCTWNANNIDIGAHPATHESVPGA